MKLLVVILLLLLIIISPVQSKYSPNSVLKQSSSDSLELSIIPIINTIECSDSGLCLVFYAQNGKCIADCYIYDRFVKIINVQNDFAEIQTISIQNISTRAGHEFNVAFVAENSTYLKIIGFYNEGGLFEVILNKEKQNVQITKINYPKSCFNYPDFSLEFPSKKINMWNDYSNLSITGEIFSDNGYGLAEITINTCSLIDNSKTAFEDYLPINKNLFYVFEEETVNNTLIIYDKRLNSDLKESLRLNNSRYLTSFIGDDSNPYLQYSDDDLVSHILQLASGENIKLNQSTFDTTILVDQFSNIHYIADTTPKTYYQINLLGETILSKNIDSLNENSTIKIYDIYNKTFLIGKFEIYFGYEGLFIIDTQFGNLITLKESMVTQFETFDINLLGFTISAIVVIAIRIKKRKI